MLKHRSHKVGLSCWHLVLATKYRYQMMRKLENKNLVAAAVRKAATEHCITLLELNVQPDHVHLLAMLPRGMTDSEAFHILKGRSAYLIFRHKKHMRLRYQKGHFWSLGGCAVTVATTKPQNATSKTKTHTTTQQKPKGIPRPSGRGEGHLL